MAVRTLAVRAWRLVIRGTVLAGFSILVLPVATLSELLLGRGLRAVGRGEPGWFEAQRRVAVWALGFGPVGGLVSHGVPLGVLLSSLPPQRIYRPQ